MSWKFWKKDDLALPDFGKEMGLNKDMGLERSPSGLDLSDHFQPSGMPQMPSMQQPTFSQTYPLQQNTPSYTPGVVQNNTTPLEVESQGHGMQKDLEIIAAKLDTIRAQLEMLNSRVANLEHQGRNEPPKRPWY